MQSQHLKESHDLWGHANRDRDKKVGRALSTCPILCKHYTPMTGYYNFSILNLEFSQCKYIIQTVEPSDIQSIFDWFLVWKFLKHFYILEFMILIATYIAGLSIDWCP